MKSEREDRALHPLGANGSTREGEGVWLDKEGNAHGSMASACAASSNVIVPFEPTQPLVQALQAIANADPSKWDPDVRDQFQAWAQSIARHALIQHVIDKQRERSHAS